MRILVTGAGGVVGHALVEKLTQTQDVITCIDGRASVDLESFGDTRAIFKFVQPTHVYHLAGAVFGVGGNVKFPGDAFRRNTLINTHVVAAAAECNVRKIVAMGTTAIYSDKAAQPFSENAALADTPHDSEMAYAFAKRGLLVQLEAYKLQYGLNFAYAIATNMYGPHDRFDAQYGHVIPSLVYKFFQAESRPGESVTVWGDGTPTRDFLFSRDAAAGLTLMMERGDGAYNLVSGRTATIRQLVETIATHFPSVPYRWDASKPNGQLRRSYETERLSKLGFAPSCNLEQGVAETVAWFRQNQASCRSY